MIIKKKTYRFFGISIKKASNEIRANYERNVEDTLAVLPKLKTGIDVNLKFNG
jgi:hypothetical protein